MIEEFDSQKFLLNSVNILLQTIGELPIEDVSDVDAIIEARIARDTLLETKMAVLSFGWDLNTDEEYELHTDENGYINVSTAMLDINVPDSSIVIRDWQLYDKETKSRKFTSSVTATIKWNLNFNSLPFAFRNYITIMASRIFQGRLIGDKTVYSFTQADEQKAFLLLKRTDGFTGQYNMLSTGNFGTSMNILG